LERPPGFRIRGFFIANQVAIEIKKAPKRG
jgi:hypothetical protein